MSGYIGNTPVPQGTQTRQSFTATAGQTSFATAGYTVGYLDVYLNGVLLTPVIDYAATNGSDIVLTSGATTGDILMVTIYGTFDIPNTAASAIFYENASVITGSYAVTAGKNALSAGPVTISSGGSVTVPSGSVWTVV